MPQFLSITSLHIKVLEERRTPPSNNKESFKQFLNPYIIYSVCMGKEVSTFFWNSIEIQYFRVILRTNKLLSHDPPPLAELIKIKPAFQGGLYCHATDHQQGGNDDAFCITFSYIPETGNFFKFPASFFSLSGDSSVQIGTHSLGSLSSN